MEQLEKNEKVLTIEPPKSTVGAIEWMKKNLFSSWLNAILTILSVYVSVSILIKVVNFIVHAEWSVISKNLRLLMIGQYPIEELWRVWLVLAILSVLLGISSGIWKGSISHVTITIGCLMAITAVMPFIEANTRMYLIINIALMFVTYFVGNKIGKVKIPVLVLWALLLPFTFLVLNGFGVFPPVETNVWGGFLLTILISFVTILFSFPIGLLLALGRRSKLPVIKWFSILYIELIRGVPLITVLFIAQLMIPLFLGDSIEIDNVLRVMIAFTLFSAAYLAENIRGGLQSLPRGQFEASQALGLNSTLMMGFIILPQALRAVIPTMVSLFIGIFKDTSLVVIVGMTDFLGMGKKVLANPQFLGKHMEVYLFIALIYFIGCFLMSHVSRRLEKSLGVGKR